MALRQRLIQAQLHLQKTDEFNPDNYTWLRLGWSRIGVKNDEGHSKEFISIGTEKDTDRNLFKIDAVEIVEKFYYGYPNNNSQTPHHTDYRYYDWTGDLRDYIKKRRREKRFA